MPILRHRTRTHALAACATLALVAGMSAPVDAAEGLFEALFGGFRTPAPVQVQPAPAADTYRPRSRRVARQRLRTRYAALPTEPLKVRVTDRQTPIDLKDGVMAAVMRDETLRPGDIVVMRTGARVFIGTTEKRHRAQDFEPVQRSQLVDGKTRRLLAAMMTPAGALPADEARRVVARARKAAPVETAAGPAPATAQAMRIINPWKMP